jgi:hypothetical protein
VVSRRNLWVGATFVLLNIGVWIRDAAMPADLSSGRYLCGVFVYTVVWVVALELYARKGRA